ncbi:MAG: DEAD/DEAH box helicase family protein, partial [Kosmotogaceae bacterium]
IYIAKEGLPPFLINELIRIAAFQNPEFYKAQAMRLLVFRIPRIIGCAEDFTKHLGIPTGCLDDIIQLFAGLGIDSSIEDERNTGTPIRASFTGALSEDQEKALLQMMANDIGVLAAATAFGKTVIAINLIAKRAVNTLVLVHRRQLQTQWLSALTNFLEIEPNHIGTIGSGKYKPSGFIDVAMIQSLNRKGIVDDIVAEYGHVVVDECHHISAKSFENVARQCKAKYITGLSATVIRKDGHHPIIFMQCGPVRYNVAARQQASKSPFVHKVVFRETGFNLPREMLIDNDLSFYQIYDALVADKRRNDLIVKDVKSALDDKRSPIILTERKKHLIYLTEQISKLTNNVIVLQGGMTAKKKKEALEKIRSLADDEERVIIATGKYLGEGFDDRRLDTLFLTLPISWRGTLAQYAGRLHRHHSSKSEVIIYDYVDSNVPVLAKMKERRLKGYHTIGYKL